VSEEPAPPRDRAARAHYDAKYGGERKALATVFRVPALPGML
jgi:hypothetical protein